MKNFTNLKFYKLAIFAFLFNFSNTISSFSQACDQLEILYTEPDCFARKGTQNGSTDKGCKEASFCEDTPYDYISSMTGLGFTYNWSATGPSAVTFLPNNSSPQVSIVWPQIGVYTLNLTVTDAIGNVFTQCLTINVQEKPVANFTFTPNNVCAGSTIQFNNSSTYSGGGMLYSWDFDDPTSNTNFSTATNPSHVFANSGTYEVTLIVSSFVMVQNGGTPQGEGHLVQKVCCSDTIKNRVTIVPGTIKIECITTVCANEIATYTAVGCANPTWLAPVGGTITSAVGNQVTIQWGNGAVQGQINVKCPGGCLASVTVPIVPAVPVAVGNLFPCVTATESYNLPILPGTFYEWRLFKQPGMVNVSSSLYTLPDNNTVWVNWNTVTSGVYTPGDTYQLFVQLKNEHNCCGPVNNFITITPRETFSAYFNQEICLGTSANLSVFPNYGTFNWSVNPTTGVVPSLGTGASFLPTFNNPGSYVVTATESTNAFCNTTDQVNITVLPATPAPGTIVGPPTVCLGDILAYSMSTNAPAGYHYSWTITSGTGTFEPGALATTTGDNVNIEWTTVPGTISVVLQRNSSPLCTSTAATLNVSLATTGAVTGTANVCVDANGGYNLTGGTVPPGTSVTWSITPVGIGTIIAGQGTLNTTIKWHGLVGAGPWTATVLATTSCGAATPFNVTIYPKFTFTLSQSSDICQPSGAILTASTVANSPTYLWSPSGSTSNPTSVTTAGTHSLTITTLGGCTFTRNINVVDPFAIGSGCTVGTCTGPGTFQEILSVGIIKPAAGTFTYEWFSGTFPAGVSVQGPVTNTSLTDSYTATVAGDYYVLVTYGNCVKQINYKVAQVCCPDVNIPQITNVVQNTCYAFTFTGTTPNPGNLPVVWSFGDGTFDATGNLNPTHIYAAAGVYCVSLCVGDANACGTNCTLTSVTVPIEANFTYNLSCNGCPNITNTSINLGPGTVTYDWNFGDGFTSLGNVSPTPPAHCYTMAGNYSLTLTVNYTSGTLTCSDSYSTPITYTPLAINVTPSPVCTDNAVTFTTNTGSAQIITYNWAFGDGNFAFTPSTTHIYTVASPPIYNVVLSVLDNTGVTCTVNSNVNVLPGFIVSLAPGYICPGGTAVLTPTITGTPVSYAWQEFVASNWVAATGTNNGPTYSATAPGIYRVIVTALNGCIVISNQVPVIAVPNPVAEISVSPSKKLCAPGGSVTLTSTNHLPGYTSQWFEGNLANPIGTGATLFNYPVNASNNYILVLTNQYGCSDMCQILIEVNPLPPMPTIFPLSVVCEGTPTVLSIPATSNNILWNTGETTNSITVFSAGIYNVTITDPITGCSNSAQKTVSTRPVVDLFPHFCQSVTCECTVPFTIYGPKPIIGAFAPAPPYVIQWYDATNTNIFTGQNLTPAVTGSYYIVMTDPATGCTNTSETYSITVPTADDCRNCNCDNSSWGNVTLTTITPTTTIIIPCNSQNPTVIECEVPYILSGVYNCFPTGCVSNVQYEITNPLNVLSTGTLPYTFVAPIPGTYTVVLTGFCNGIKCRICEFRFNACPPLDVNLVTFKGLKIDKHIDLEWVTANEINNDYFVLERSNDGQLFSKLSEIKSQNALSNEKQSYKYIDMFPFEGINYYRLKAVDNSSKITDSKIIAVDFDEIEKPKIYPNPSKTDRVTLEIPANSIGEIKLEWYDLLGRLFKTIDLNGQMGKNKFEINTSDLPVGKYLIKITQENKLGLSQMLSFEK